MTEEQIRFKILKREKYEEQISQENKMVVDKTCLFGLAAAAAFCSFSEVSNANTEDMLRFFHWFLAVANTGFGVYHLKGLIEAISRKTMLQGKVEDINTELNMPKNEKSRGMRR